MLSKQMQAMLQVMVDVERRAAVFPGSVVVWTAVKTSNVDTLALRISYPVDGKMYNTLRHWTEAQLFNEDDAAREMELGMVFEEIHRVRRAHRG